MMRRIKLQWTQEFKVHESPASLAIAGLRSWRELHRLSRMHVALLNLQDVTWEEVEPIFLCEARGVSKSDVIEWYAWMDA
jgi:hypothetical protein